MNSPRRSILSRADLLDALLSHPQEEDGHPASSVRYLAGELHLEWEPPKQTLAEKQTISESTTPQNQSVEPDIPAVPLRDALFWYFSACDFFTDPYPVEQGIPAARKPFEKWRNEPRQAPRFQPLATWAELAPRLRQVLSDYRTGRAIDVPKTLKLISRGEVLSHFPRERRRRWGPSLVLIEDDSRRLIPYRADKRLVREAIRRLLPNYALGRALMDDGTDIPLPLSENAEQWPPPPGTLVLVLGDLGCLALNGISLRQGWLELGLELSEAGCHPLALFPAPLSRCPQPLADIWRIIPWERPRRADDGRSLAQRAERLLRIVSPAARIEPGLLRAVRLLLPEAAADAGTEADVWQHAALAGDSAAGATITPAEAKRLRAKFAEVEPLALRRRLIRTIKQWRGGLPPEIWFDELLNCDPMAIEADPNAADDPGLTEDLGDDLDDARRYFADFCDDSSAQAIEAMPAYDRDWLARIDARSTKHLCADAVCGSRLAELLVEVTARLPDGTLPRDIGPRGKAERRVQLIQTGRRLALAQVWPEPGRAGGRLAEVATCNGLIQIEPMAEHAPEAFWESGQAPAWAQAWGWDGCGAWVEFAVAGQDGRREVQRMRWIKPGDYLMGSPPNETGRFSNEGPQHRVKLDEGFWLFDTPCTQALWEAVMDDNPSRFKSPQRPVEQVSWEDVQVFIQRLNAKIPGLELALPSEAQWEYACRAGTDTALYSGPLEILGENNAPTLDAIAWYGGNSGEGFDLAEGVDSSSWPEMQYPNPISGSRKVGQKHPNPWGLYDMLGNVWEWVQDDWHRNYDGAPDNGSVWESGDTGAARVVRGGSWNNLALNCRCACRFNFQPDDRGNFLGFRCARVQA